MARQLFIYVDGDREGPFEVDEVRELLEEGSLDFDDYCQPVGSAKRLRLGEIFEIVPDEAAAEDAEVGEGEEDGEGEGGRGLVRERDGRILYAGRPSLMNYPVALLVAAASGIGGYLLGPKSLWFFAGGSLVALAVILWVAVDRSTRLYLVTARRVEVIRGLLVKSSNEVLVKDIRTINVRRSGLRGLLGVGTVEFSSAGDGIDVGFEHIRAAQRVKRLVRALQDGEA